MDLFFIFVMGTLFDTFINSIFSVFFVTLFFILVAVVVVDDATVVVVDDVTVVVVDDATVAVVDDATIVIVDDGKTVVDVVGVGVVTALRCLGIKASSLNDDFLACLFAIECEDELLPVISNVCTSLPFRSIVILKYFLKSLNVNVTKVSYKKLSNRFFEQKLQKSI